MGRAMGERWYTTVTSRLLTHNDAHRVGSLLALFSPRVPVKRSVNFTKFYMETNTYRHDVVRTVRAAVDHWEQTGIIRGPKTSAFRDALLGDPNAVVLDVWMSKLFNVEQKVFSTKSGYALYSDKIRRLADKNDMTPRDTQASLWCGYLTLVGRKPPVMDISTLFPESELFYVHDLSVRS